MRALFSGLSAIALLGASATATPPDDTANLEPATLTYAQLYAKHLAAIGTASASPFSTERSRVREGDLDGTSTYASAGDDFREDVTLGPVHRAWGRLNGVRWRQGPNGFTRIVEGIHDESTADLAAGVPTLIGTNASLHAYVVRKSDTNEQQYLFYDQTTFLLVRTERARGGLWVTTAYDDFALDDGHMRARHVKSTDGEAYGDYEEWLESSTHARTVDRAALAMPPQREPLAIPGGRARLPAKILGDRIVVEARIGNRKINLQLDSGASTVFVDDGIAEALDLKQYGHSTQTVAGTFVAREALVPTLAIGPLAFDNFYVETGPGDFSIDADTPIAGLLGADVLSSCVFAIDYAAGTVDALDARSFSPPSGAIVLPVRLDDGVPAIGVQIGAAKSHTFILDTGADRSMLFDRFLQANPRDIVDRGLGSAEMAASPYSQYVGGVGGTITVRMLEVSDFRLGTIAFARWPFYAVSSGQSAFEGEDYDGLIGQDVLRYFTVYLDYPHERIVLAPNARYTARFL